MPWLGDIFIPIVTSKDTSISRNVVEKNFVDEDPQVFELPPDLESGTYSVILNEKIHERGETFREQIDALKSLSSRDASELPFELAGDKGYLVVNASSASIIPSQEIREGEIELRFMEHSSYRPALNVVSEHYSEDFSPTAKESLVALPSSATSVEDSGGTLSPNYTIPSEEGDLDLYLYSDNLIEYDHGYKILEGNYGEDYGASYGGIGAFDEITSPVRIYAVSGNYGEDYGEKYGGDLSRIYSDEETFNDVVLDNGVLKASSFGDSSALYRYDSANDDWKLFGNVPLKNSDGYTPLFNNYHSSIDFIGDHSLSLFRGYSVARYSDVTDTTEFRFSAKNALSSGTDNGYYYSVTDSAGNDIILVRTSNDGNFRQDSGDIIVENLDSTVEYDFFVGYVPDPIPVSDYARYVFNRGSWRRTLVQR